ncbi:MAG: hypothetical protein E2594_17070 [Pseudomonas sp.]|nr:hypothetical protein [Pseudomonas sp.]
MTVSALRFEHAPTNKTHSVPIRSLADAREITDVIDREQCSNIRISYFSDYHHCEVITHQFTDGEFITTRKRM